MRRDLVDHPNADSLQAARQALDEAGRAHGVYALLDRGFVSDAEWSGCRFAPTMIDLYAGRYGGNGLAGLSPQLCALPAEFERRDAWLTDMFRVARGRPMLSFIATDMPKDELIRHLQAQLEAEVESEERFIVRIADTRCLPAWADTLDASQHQRFFSGLRAWWYFDRAGQWVGLPFDGNASTQEQYGEPFYLTHAQHGSLQRAALPDTLIAYIASRPVSFGTLKGAPSRIHDCVATTLARVADGTHSVSADTYRQLLADMTAEGLLAPDPAASEAVRREPMVREA